MATKSFSPAPARAPEEQSFRFSNGSGARDLKEFVDVVAQADVGVVEFHRTHFHYWVREVLREERLADDLRRIGDNAGLRGEALRLAITDAIAERTGARKAAPAFRRK